MGFFAGLPTLTRWTVYYLLLFGIYVSLFYITTVQEFYYFQF